MDHGNSIWEPISHGGVLHSRIVAQIEGLIRDRRLQSGDRLPPERNLAQLLGISRPSLREAMKTLEAGGRLRVRHGTGVWIQQPDPLLRLSTDREVALRDLFAMRRVLEEPAAAWAAKAARRQDVALLQRLLDGMTETGDIAELKRLDIEFHLRIAELGGNRFLRQTVGVLHQMLREGMETTLRIPGRSTRSRVEHQEILNAIKRGDATAAKRAARVHIARAQSAAMKRMTAEERTREGNRGKAH